MRVKRSILQLGSQYIATIIQKLSTTSMVHLGNQKKNTTFGTTESEIQYATILNLANIRQHEKIDDGIIY